MLRHIVSMKMDGATAQERANNAADLTSALNGLVGKIDQIRALSVSPNVVERPGNWDLALVVDLDNADDLELYRAHPDHVLVLELITRVVADRCAVDFIV